MGHELAEPVLVARGLGFRRGDRWLFKDVHLELRAGEFLALVGPSGVGKSTLMACLCGLLEPTEGHVIVSLDGATPSNPNDFRRQFGIIYQDLQLTPNADLITNVLCGRLGRYRSLRTLFGFPKALRNQAYQLLCELGVGRDPRKWASHMSGGEKQRVAIARALFQEPSVYFADEPVSSLDTYYAGRVLGLLRQEADVQKRSIVCVLHQAEHIQRFADLTLSLNPNNPSAHNIRWIRPRGSEVAK